MRYVMFGAGRQLNNMVRESLAKLDYVVDNNAELWGTSVFGKIIYPPNKLMAEKKDELLIIIGCMEFYTSVKIQLDNMGFRQDADYVWAATFLGNKHIPDFYNRAKWNELQTEFWNDNVNTRLRSQAAISLVDFSEIQSVLDLGAGQFEVKEFLPPNVEYIPVDYLERIPGQIVADFNDYEFPDITADCVLLLGVVQYIKDWKWLMTKAVEAVNTDGVLMYLGLNSSRAKELKWNSFPFTIDVILFMKTMNMELVDGMDWRLYSTILKFKKIQ